MESLLFLVVVTKPQSNQHSKELNQTSQVSNLNKIAQESENQRILKNGGWKCPVCSKVNPSGLITCACGTRKPNKYETADKISKQTKLEDTGWKCYKCGTLNPQNVYICKCGIKKSENKANLANNQTETDNNQNINNVEAIKKYKELLDIGAITQDEYNTKKAELLK